MKIIIFLLIFSIQAVFAQEAKRLDSLKQIVIKHPKDSLGIDALCHLTYEFAPVDFDKAYQYARQALQIAQNLQDKKNEAYALNMIAIAYDYQSKFEKALEYYLKSLKIQEAINNQSGIATGYGNIGVCYYFQNELDKALEWYLKALKIREKMKDNLEIARLYNNMGAIYRKKKKYKEAVDVYQKSLKIKQAQNDKKGIASTLTNIGIVYQYEGDLEKALDYHKQSLKIEEEIQNPYGISASHIGIGEILILQKNYTEASQNYQKAREISEKAGNKELLYKSYLGLFQTDSLQGNLKDALRNYQLYSLTKDEIFNENKSQQMIQMQTLYETEKKERQIEVQKKENANLRLTNIFAFTTTTLALFILALLYNRYLLRSKQQQLALEKEKADNQRIIAEKIVEQEKNVRLQEDIDFKNRELSSTLLNIAQKNKILSEIREKMEGLSILQSIEPNIRQRLKEMVKIVWRNLNSEDDWTRFKVHFEQVHPNFFKILSEKYPDLNPKELKFCAYVKMNLDTKEIANMISISVRGIEGYRYRIRKKMNLESEANLAEVLQQV